MVREGAAPRSSARAPNPLRAREARGGPRACARYFQLHRVPAELGARVRDDLRGERLLLAGRKAREERIRERRHRHRPLDGLVQGPAPFPRVLDVTTDVREPGILLEGTDEKLEKRGADDGGVRPQP